MLQLTPELPLNIDSTMLSCFRSCPRKFYLEFVLGLRPTGLSVDLHAGACFASTLEFIYTELGKGHHYGAVLPRAFAFYLEQWGDFEVLKDTPKTKERVWDAIEEYFATYSPKTDEVQPYLLEGRPSMEFTFAIPLVPNFSGHADDEMANWDTEPGIFPRHPSGAPFVYSGRFDMLGLWGEKIVVRDEKTTTSIGATWAGQWDLRSQFMGYVWACQQSGLAVDTVCVRGIGILKTKISMAQIFKTYPSYMIERWYEQMRRDLWRIRRMWDEGYFDYNLADSCSSYGGCAFKTPCGSEVPERWFEGYTVRRWNPLHKNPVAESAAIAALKAETTEVIV